MDLSGVVLAILSGVFSPLSFALKTHLPEQKVQQGGSDLRKVYLGAGVQAILSGVHDSSSVRALTITPTVDRGG